jgi:hypothetical protein
MKVRITDDPAVEADRSNVEISMVQFCIGLARFNLITNAEAVALASTGAIPQSMQAAVDALPDNVSKFEVRIRLCRLTTVNRTGALARLFKNAYSLTESQVDQFFRACSNI